MAEIPQAAAAEPLERVKLDENFLYVPKIYLKTLVEKLESEQWLKKKNERLLIRLETTKELAVSLRQEIALQEKTVAKLKEAIAATKERLKIVHQKNSVLMQDAKDYREMMRTSRQLDESQEKQKNSLRRRLAGQKYVLGTVSAVGGALIILLLL
ncbi:MAG: hypothetical protein IEMM0002_0927 [bacterium]|nr:MAG: hypothetical protein IEMM0002_0927 [bacterium]